jgi:hypothetical protein
MTKQVGVISDITLPVMDRIHAMMVLATAIVAAAACRSLLGVCDRLRGTAVF